MKCKRFKKSKKFEDNTMVCYYCRTKRQQKIFAQRFRLSKPISKGAERRKRIKDNGGYYTKSEWENLKKKYDYRCLKCGRQEPEIRLQADHITPVIRGGQSWISNIQPLCSTCNCDKATKIIDYRVAKIDTPP